MFKFLICVALFSFYSQFTLGSVDIRGQDLIAGKLVSFEKGKISKARVLVFLSAKCPCSNNHIEELRSLSLKYKDVEFVGIHSNSDESSESSAIYFKSLNLSFPVIQDEQNKIADEYKAFKTPHAYVLSAKGEVLYHGGVTNSSNPSKADRHFLQEALSDIDAGLPVRTSEGRTLGCMISRGDKVETNWK